MSLKNLALLVFTGALILSGCGGGSKPPQNPPPTPVVKKLAFAQEPGLLAAGGTFSPTVAVAALDEAGNRVTQPVSITVELGVNIPNGTLSGTRTATTVDGVASFPDLSLDKVGYGFTLLARAQGVDFVTSRPFDVGPGPAKGLVFFNQPTREVTHERFVSVVNVGMVDAHGNYVLDGTGEITLTLSGGATLVGVTTARTDAGNVGFSDLSVHQVGTFTLIASSPSLESATSAPVEIIPGPPRYAVLRSQPATTTAGEPLAKGLEVEVRDEYDNLVTHYTGPVVAELLDHPVEETLRGTTRVNAVAGVARFDDLSLTKAAQGRRLRFYSPNSEGATSQQFDILPGPASVLAFTTQPSNLVAGAAFTPAVAVDLRDIYGNLATTTAADVQLTLANNPSGGTLSGTLTVSATGGVATFPGVALGRVGTGYTLTASGAGLSATSAAFNVTVGAASRLAFDAQPSSVAAGIAIAPAVTVRVTDSQGNTVSTPSASVTVAFGNNPGVGILNGTRTVTTVNGVATFSTLSVTRTGVGYTLTAAATGFPTVTSAAFNVTPGAATSLAFHRNPPNVVTAGAAITPDVQVSVRDGFNNVVTTSTASITISMSTNPGGSTLGGTRTVAAVDGVASFPGLTLNRVANNYRFAAASPGLTGTTSALFNVTAGPASQLAFTAQPASVVSGATLATVRVTVQDALGNPAATTASTVALALGNNPGNAALGGTLSATTVSGVATFSNLTLDKVGTGYTLVASSGTLPTTTSTGFNVTAGAAARLAFTVQPGDTPAGVAFNPAVQVSVQDANGNPVTSTASITLGLGNNPGGGTLAGTTVLGATGGVATFPGVSLARAGTGYTLTATATGLATATSTAFAVAPGAGTRLVFTVQPTRVFVGQAVSPAVRVAVQDAFGNVATGASDSITVALGNNPSNATLAGTLTAPASSGVAAFTDLAVDAQGTGYTLIASTEGLTGATSAAFDAVVAGTRLVYTAPAASRRIALVRNPASTDTSVVLDLVAQEALTGYSVGMNLPLDASLVQAGANVMVPGTALPAGTAPTAAFGRLPSSGPLAGVLSSGQSQKAAGPGAVADDSAIPAGAVLYTVQLELRPGATSGVVFDGAALGPKFKALLRDKLGTDVVDGSGFAIGRLAVE
ncbi:hypothetical protein [Pyxidicoccus xibeiensis]|uniref:hypothetical protein n=1 Tax=Pyxidicoccus xibeiensis TaxID=2906759 RepID=UPI0020A81F1D|nr:hypothetical protein [Pyxidicoccus xibeiensis]MCP3140952.1 hypothetical protein [Pyxidicoccus xibeiensis]